MRTAAESGGSPAVYFEVSFGIVIFVNMRLKRVLYPLIPAICFFVTLSSCVKDRTEAPDFDEVINNYEDGPSVYYMDVARLNLALAETGQLADKVFHYTQAGSDGILVPWNLTAEAGERLSDAYWSMGHIAYSQRMAFEANVMDERDVNPRMVKRLIETNLVFGAYPVARKYIDILGKEKGWKKAAEGYRRFLDNDAAVEADPELGPRRRCVPEKDFISLVRGIDEYLKDIIRFNPGYHKAIEYLGVIYLLDCEMDKFKEMLDEFYGTEALPELPASFAEAACMLSEIDRGYWKKVGVSSEMYKKYNDFKSRLENGLTPDKHKDTFWYYIMRVNSL